MTISKTTIIAIIAGLGLANGPAHADNSTNPIVCTPENAATAYDFYGEIHTSKRGIPKPTGPLNSAVTATDLSCPQVASYQAYVQFFSGDDSNLGIHSKSSTLWSWTGSNCSSICDPSGSGECADGYGHSLAFAAGGLSTNDCQTGQLCKIGQDGACFDYPYIK